MYLPFGLFSKLITNFFNLFMDQRTDLNDGIDPCFILIFVNIQVEPLEFILSNFIERINRPRVEPVYCRAVDYCREVPNPGSEFLPNRVHRHDNVQSLPDA